MNLSGNILFFDGVCNLCNGLVRFIIKKDKRARIRFAPIQMQYPLLTKDMDTVIYISENITYVKSSAILHVLKDIGGIWRLFYGLIIIPRAIRDFFYEQVARSRYVIFGKKDTCMVPDPDIADRFLT